MKGWTDNQSNSFLLRKRMTTKFPSTLILVKADDLTEKFDSFDSQFRVKLLWGAGGSPAGQLA